MDLITFLIKWSDVIWFGKQMRVVESFHFSTNLFKKTKIVFFYGMEGVPINNVAVYDKF
jgi:hypothetical protein